MGLAKTFRKMYRAMADRSILSRIGSYAEIDGFLTRAEAAALHRCASQLPPGAHVLEIGCWKGKSTYCIASGLTPGEGKVYVIDPFNAAGESGSKEVYHEAKGELPLMEQFKANMRRRGVLDRIEILQGYSQEFAGKVPPLGMLFIDGDHSIGGAKADFDNFSDQVSPGGFIAFHDYDAQRADLGPTWVTHNRLLPGGKFVFHGLFDRLWVGKRV